MSVCKCFQPLSDVSHLFFFLSKLSNKNTCLPSRYDYCAQLVFEQSDVFAFVLIEILKGLMK